MAGSYIGHGEWPTWLDNATQTPACRGYDTDLFFPTTTTKGDTQVRQTTEAKAICFTCPLLNPCREWALSQPLRHLAGIWGGTTMRDRERLLRERRVESGDRCRG